MFKLLAVDVQGGPKPGTLGSPKGNAAREGAARLYLHGDDGVYDRGGVMADMRKPYLGVSAGRGGLSEA